MFLKKEQVSSNFKSKSSYKTIYVWCLDGWVYDIKSKQRMKYWKTNNGYEIKKESWNIINEPFFIEELEIFIIDSNTWIEIGTNVSEKFTIF